MVKVKQLKTWEDVVKNCGSGSLVGCEVCKPAVGSILASLCVSLPHRLYSSLLRQTLTLLVFPCLRFNEPILNPSHHKLQDTNDKFLANMQRDGTFSVVPRIAAGEITPDGLIAIGEVARKWGMYTKVRTSITSSFCLVLFCEYLDALILTMAYRRLRAGKGLTCSEQERSNCRLFGKVSCLSFGSMTIGRAKIYVCVHRTPQSRIRERARVWQGVEDCQELCWDELCVTFICTSLFSTRVHRTTSLIPLFFHVRDFNSTFLLQGAATV
jgi:hypothetical protein